jgi:hypothetical protein
MAPFDGSPRCKGRGSDWGEPDMQMVARGDHIGADDPHVWSGSAVQEASSTWLMRSCINVSGLCLERVCAPGHNEYQRACDLISG